jgi:acyl-coenzyme A synthetase/AMP-(fatty) acid ligase
MVPELALTMLACARIGASVVFAGFEVRRRWRSASSQRNQNSS